MNHYLYPPRLGSGMRWVGRLEATGYKNHLRCPRRWALDKREPHPRKGRRKVTPPATKPTSKDQHGTIRNLGMPMCSWIHMEGQYPRGLPRRSVWHRWLRIGWSGSNAKHWHPVRLLGTTPNKLSRVLCFMQLGGEWRPRDNPMVGTNSMVC